MVFTGAEVYKLEPCVFYVDDVGEVRKAKVEPVTMATRHHSVPKLETVAEPLQSKFALSIEAAEKVHTSGSPSSSFPEDTQIRRLPLDKSRWRTLMEVSRNAQITTFRVSGRGGRGRKATSIQGGAIF